MKTAAIILHFKNPDITCRCVESVLRQNIAGSSLRIIIVSNSQDQSLNEVMSFCGKKNGKKIQITPIQNRKNSGFAKGMNTGIREALKDPTMEYCLILNNDTVFPSGSLMKLLTHPADITGPVVRFRALDGSLVYDYGGHVNRWTGRTTHEESAVYPDRSAMSRQPDYISGCCMLIKRRVFEKIGYFDETYFFYFEDADFCIRAVDAGFRITVSPDAVMDHLLGGSIGRWTGKAILYTIIGNYIFISKRLGVRRITGYLYLTMLTVKILINSLRGK